MIFPLTPLHTHTTYGMFHSFEGEKCFKQTEWRGLSTANHRHRPTHLSEFNPEQFRIFRWSVVGFLISLGCIFFRPFSNAHLKLINIAFDECQNSWNSNDPCQSRSCLVVHCVMGTDSRWSAFFRVSNNHKHDKGQRIFIGKSLSFS